MSGLIICGIIGACFGGPIGAVVGVAIGIIAYVHEKNNEHTTKSAENEAVNLNLEQLRDRYQRAIKEKESTNPPKDIADIDLGSKYRNISKSLDVKFELEKISLPSIDNKDRKQKDNSTKVTRSNELQGKINQEFIGGSSIAIQQKKPPKKENSELKYNYEFDYIPYEHNSEKEELNLLLNDIHQGKTPQGYEISGNWREGWARRLIL